MKEWVNKKEGNTLDQKSMLTLHVEETMIEKAINHLKNRVYKNYKVRKNYYSLNFTSHFFP